jgi:sortase A
MPVHPNPCEPERTDSPTPRAGRSRGVVPSAQRLGRRAFLALAASGLLLAGCQKKEEIVYVDSSVPTATPLPPPAPTLSPTAPPAPAQGQGPIALAPPVPIVPVPGLAAQAQVIPPLQMRNHAYTTWLQPPDRLQIPSIDLDTKVVPITTKVDQRGAVIWETAAFAVGYHRGSGLPGENGNVVLSGHISSPREGAVFNKLPKVKPGDGIIVSTPDRQYLYVVAETKTVTPDTVEVLDPTDHAILTMITCVPDGVYSHRLVVRAEAV